MHSHRFCIITEAAQLSANCACKTGNSMGSFAAQSIPSALQILSDGAQYMDAVELYKISMTDQLRSTVLTRMMAPKYSPSAPSGQEPRLNQVRYRPTPRNMFTQAKAIVTRPHSQ